MEEDNILNPHATKSTAEFRLRAKHYGISLDWSKKHEEMEKKDKIKFDHLANKLKIESLMREEFKKIKKEKKLEMNEKELKNA